MKVRDYIKWYAKPWVIGVALLSGLLLCLVSLLFLWISKPPSSSYLPATAILNVIHVPTATPAPPTPSPTPPVDQNTNEGGSEIRVGGFVQVANTSGESLRLRSKAGLSGNILYLAPEGELFQVLNGPEIIDNYTWWFLTSLDDQARKGWAVANYLINIPAP